MIAVRFYMFTLREHIDNLTRHIRLVQEACVILATRLAEKGRTEFATALMRRGFVHDASKFSGIEWDYLHQGPDVPKEALSAAVRQHVLTNDHHPEFWGGIDNMPEIAVAEMVCDWYARAQEFGTSLREWCEQKAVKRFGIKVDGEVFQWIRFYTDVLIPDTFVK